MSKRILIINGHPDISREHFTDALLDAYSQGAEAAGHSIDLLRVAELDFTLLRSKEEWEKPSSCPAIILAQQRLLQADHILLAYPLWLGGMPAILKGFLEQVLRPDLIGVLGPTGIKQKRLLGKSVRILVTMGMPALAYRWFFGAHSLRNLKRNILGFCGFSPVRSTLIGMIEGREKHHHKALKQLNKLGFMGK